MAMPLRAAPELFDMRLSQRTCVWSELPKLATITTGARGSLAQNAAAMRIDSRPVLFFQRGHPDPADPRPLVARMGQGAFNEEKRGRGTWDAFY